MAIVNNGIKNELSESQIPATYTRPTITDFADETYLRRITFNVLKSTVEDANPATTMTNILDNATIGLNKQLNDIIANDFISTNTVETFGIWNALTNNLTSISGKSDFLTANAINFVCTVDIYIKIS